jgi:hypothetical protein
VNSRGRSLSKRGAIAVRVGARPKRRGLKGAQPSCSAGDYITWSAARRDGAAFRVS